MKLKYKVTNKVILIIEQCAKMSVMNKSLALTFSMPNLSNGCKTWVG